MTQAGFPAARSSSGGIDTPMAPDYLRPMIASAPTGIDRRPSPPWVGLTGGPFVPLLLLLLLLGGLPPGALPLGAQAAAVGDGGVVEAGLLLRQLDGEKRVLMIGAHPDDEDTGLLAMLARGMGAQTAYLSLTRGEGGQNLIGPELDEGLGIIRTGELVAARRLDGGRQFFTRAFDFGFSKNAPETFGYWPREELLRDVVEVIRRFRPHVVVSVFSGTPRDGHGHHQVSGMISTEAFSAAGDPTRFPEQIEDGLAAWQPGKLYQRFRGIPGDETLPVQVGEYDPLLGRSHFQLAMESRSQHRSQDMGAAQSLGPRRSSVTLTALAPGVEEGGEGLFAGVDTTLVGLAGELEGPVGRGVRDHLEGYREEVARAQGSLTVLDPFQAAAPLAAALEYLSAVEELLPLEAPADLEAGLEHRREVATRALLAVSSVELDVRVDQEVVIPGGSVTLEMSLWNGGEATLRGMEPTLTLPEDWEAETLEGEGPVPTGMESFLATAAEPSTGPALEPGALRRWRWRVTVPEDEDPSRLFYLAQEREGEMYRWPEDREIRGLPRNPGLVRGSVDFTLSTDPGAHPAVHGEQPAGDPVMDPSVSGGEVLQRGVPVSVGSEGRFVGVDKALGEFTRPLLVLPALSVATDPRVMAWPTDETGSRTITVRVRSQSAEPLEGTVTLEVPEGWQREPESARVRWTGAGAEASVAFQLRRSAAVGGGITAAGSEGASGSSGDAPTVTLRALARTDDGREFDEGFAIIDYPHIRPAPLFRPARVQVPVFPVQVAPGLRVAYVEGSGDDGVEVLRQMGAEVEILTPAQVAAGGLEGFDTAVLGVRVYEVVPEMVPATPALLDFARSGGTVVVQYNKYEYPEGNLAPYPVAMTRPHGRVTDETAEVTLLDPESPVFTTPNRITPGDFQGWVQERGLYFLSEWGEPFVPLLEMSDPGEAPLQGSLLVAPVGEGLYVYTGLAFFRQFPEGVPGAYRLFANLVSLRPDVWREHHAPGTPGRVR